MARDAIARLYDVDDETLKFHRLRLTEKYDQATITFRARDGWLVLLDKVHESIWATRLSGGTRSGVICFEVTAVGEVVARGGELVLKVAECDREFILVADVQAKPQDAKKSVLRALKTSASGGIGSVRVTGYVEGWNGRWPGVLSKRPETSPRLMVTGFEELGSGS